MGVVELGESLHFRGRVRLASIWFPTGLEDFLLPTGSGGADIWKDDSLAIPISTTSSSSEMEYHLSGCEVRVPSSSPTYMQPGGKPAAVQPPKVMVDLGVCKSDEGWLIKKVSTQALPTGRSIEIKFLAKWHGRNLWRVVENVTNKVACLPFVYVDDLLVLGGQSAHNGLHFHLEDLTTGGGE